MYVKVLVRDGDYGLRMETLDNVQNILYTTDGIAFEVPNNQLALYLHKDIYSINITQEKPEI